MEDVQVSTATRHTLGREGTDTYAERGHVVDLITSAEFAEIARTAPETVRYWRHISYGPAGFKVGRRVLYDRAAVESWLLELRDQAAAKTA